MVYLRATQKVLGRLPPRAADDLPSDTALGDWFVTRFIVDRQPLLILVSGASLLPILDRAIDLKSVPDRLAGMVANRLARMGVDEDLIDREIEAMREVGVAATNNRSVVGTMVEFVKTVPYFLPHAATWDSDVFPFAEEQLADTPCRGSNGDTIWPDRAARDLLSIRWGRRPEDGPRAAQNGRTLRWGN